MKLFIYRQWRKLRKAEHWLVAKLTFRVLDLLKRLPPQKATRFAAWVARGVGPLSSRHRIALDNLRHAFPEKSESEIKEIALEMWSNMAKLLAEYVFLDQIFDFDPQAATPGIVEVEGIEIFKKIKDRSGPVLFFTAHTGNFELLPICAATFDLEVTALFRAPNNQYMAKKVLEARRTNMGHLVPSKAGAVWSLVDVLERGGAVGMLVDQKFQKGAVTQFFGRTVGTNPLLPKLARQFNAQVYPARCIRLPGGRFKLHLEDKIELPRNHAGAIDITASCQMLNDIVERWVREYPGQWMWFHKRWQRPAKMVQTDAATP
jgi:Kdo2-lipid IVA lauroyltransferase/acyltransferase